MPETWRLLETGLASAARNIALNRALLEARDADEIPSTLRFFRFPPSALLGSRQSAGQELDCAACATHAIGIQRRVSGGGAWYVDERSLGWELYLHRRDLDRSGRAGTHAISGRILHAAATALAALGLDARYRSRDEIEIGGRTLCTAAHAAEGNAVLYQAAIPIDVDAARLTRVLRLPVPRGVEALGAVHARVAGLTDATGRHPDLNLVKRNLAEAFESEFDIEFREGDLTLSEHARFERALREIETADWVDLIASPAAQMPVLEGVLEVPGGLLRATIKYESGTQTVRRAWFAGDLSARPGRALNDLEAALCDVPMHRLGRQIESFFARGQGLFEGLGPRDFVSVVQLAAGQPLAA